MVIMRFILFIMGLMGLMGLKGTHSGSKFFTLHSSLFILHLL